MSNFMKIRSTGAELFHADRRTYTTKLTVALQNSAKAPNMCAKHKPTFSEKLVAPNVLLAAFVI